MSRAMQALVVIGTVIAVAVLLQVVSKAPTSGKIQRDWINQCIIDHPEVASSRDYCDALWYRKTHTGE